MAAHSSALAWRIQGDGGAWWAAVYGVTQSWTRLTRLSSSNPSLKPSYQHPYPPHCPPPKHLELDYISSKIPGLADAAVTRTEDRTTTSLHLESIFYECRGLFHCHLLLMVPPVTISEPLLLFFPLAFAIDKPHVHLNLAKLVS